MSARLEFSQELVRDEPPEEWGEPGEGGEDVVDDGGRVLVEAQLGRQVQREHACWIYHYMY